MRLTLACAILAVGLVTGCNQQSSSSTDSSAAPQLEAPEPDTQPNRTFDPANDAARAATGAHLVVATTTRLPDAGQAGDAQEVVTLTGANGVVVEAQITGTSPLATQVGGQTLRALLALPVDESQVLVYRVTNETKQNNAGLCGADATAFVVVWDPETPGNADYKVLGVRGGQPGAADARPCTMLDYHEN